MSSHFGDRLIEQCQKKKSLVLVGIDPRFDQLPIALQKLGEKEGKAKAFEIFGKEIIDAVKDIAVAIKPQIAFYELLGPDGFAAFQSTLFYAKMNGLLTISDAKRGDIGSTAEAYAEAFLSENAAFPSDAVTVNGYLGHDGISPFLKYCGVKGKGIYILVKTSNPGSVDFQDKTLEGGKKLFEVVAEKVDNWGKEFISNSGYSSVGAVVGATWPDEAQHLRKLMPNTPFLIPGYGAQGGTAKDALASMDKHNRGGIVNSSRGIIFAYRLKEFEKYAEKNWQMAVQLAAEKMRSELNS
jgi:orotidine-5'-phosphate decarboxylase